MQGYVQLYITTKDAAQARQLARHLLTKKLAACANIFPRTETLYLDDGELQETQEAVLILKTTKDNVAAATAEIKAQHTYDVPCVLSFAVDAGEEHYLQWIAKETHKEY